MKDAAFAILGFGAAFTFLWMIWNIICIIGGWKVFTKAGEAGWKSIIPLYSSYIYFKISWNPIMFWIMFAFAVIGACLGRSEETFQALIGGVCSLISSFLVILQNIRLARAFGHSTLYGMGLFFLSPIFTVLLGFGGSQYIGPQR